MKSVDEGAKVAGPASRGLRNVVGERVEALFKPRDCGAEEMRTREYAYAPS